LYSSGRTIKSYWLFLGERKDSNQKERQRCTKDGGTYRNENGLIYGIGQGFGADSHENSTQREGNEGYGGSGDQGFGIHIVSFLFFTYFYVCKMSKKIYLCYVP